MTLKLEPVYRNGSTPMTLVGKPEISVVIGSYNRRRLLKIGIQCIRAEMARHKIPYEIIVVDGGSRDGSVSWLTSQKDIILVLQHNRTSNTSRKSWGYFMNLGFKIAQGKYILMLSDDCLIVPGAIANGYKYFESLLARNLKVGSLAFYWRNWPTDKDYFVGITLGNNLFVNHGMYLRRAIEEAGFIDEDTYEFYCADGDLCLKLAHKGYFCLDSKGSYVEHFFHSNPNSRRQNQLKAKRDWEEYLAKWRTIYQEIPEGKHWLYVSFDDRLRTYRKFLFALTGREMLLLLVYSVRNHLNFFKSEGRRLLASFLRGR